MYSASFLPQQPPAILVLADGSLFSGISWGVDGMIEGEVVFNTAMTGYQEILTDPSYAEQLVTLTYPHIGNVGINAEDAESSQVWPGGLILREMSPLVSNWRAQASLPEYLQQHKVLAIGQIDTRRLTRILREKGAQNACLMAGHVDFQQALAKARAYPGLAGKDLTERVSVSKITDWQDPHSSYSSHSSQFHVVVYDFGVKRNILRRLAARHCRVTLVPAKTTADEVLALKPHGIVLSNGPGDPAACVSILPHIKKLLLQPIPIFGICLGFQLIALSSQAKTYKMKLGHHGANHPVQDLSTRKVFITSQNHGFAVDENSLPAEFKITHRSLFDGSVQGIAHCTKPIFGFQGHPEASPGPQDIDYLFDAFIHKIARQKMSESCQNAQT